MNQNLFSGTLYQGAIAALLCNPLQSFADDEDLYGLSLQELVNVKIITNASLLTENTLTASATVDSVTRQHWQQQSARSLVDTLQHVPGVYTSYNLVANDAISIRGNSSSPGVRGISMQLDGVPLNGIIFSTALYHSEGFSLGLLEQVDVIRGPGSALYGADAFQGVISLTSRELEAGDAIAEFQYGGNDYQAATIASSQNLAEWKLSGIIDYRDSSADISYDYGNTLIDQDLQYSRSVDFEREISSAMVKVSRAINNHWQFDSSYVKNQQDRFDVRHLGPDIENAEQSPERTTVDDFDNHSSLELLQARVKGQLDNGLNLSVQAYTWDADWRWGVIQPAMVNTFKQEYRETRDGLIAYIKRDDKTRALNWSAGLEYAKHDNKRDRLGVGFKGYQTEPVTDTGWPVINAGEGYDRHVRSVFSELRYAINEQWLVNLGGRGDNYSDFDTQWSPRAGIIFQPDNSSAIKVLYGQAFRAPAINEINYKPSDSRGFTLGNEDITPETVDTYELVLMKSTTQQSVELVGYYTEIEDGIIRQPIPDNTLNQFSYYNTAKIRSTGAELKYAYHWQHAKSNIAIAYADSKDTGNEISLDAYPRWMIDWGMSYEWSGQQLELTLNSRIMLDRKAYQRTSTTLSPSDLDNYVRFDLHLLKTINPHWELSLDILNLQDRDNNTVGQIGINETSIPEDGITPWLGLRYSY
ncbi:TonB-dependent receptor plug domain-containing protein [Oceanicoccus sagamiensis]|uniref:TonB-dependent receptor n=1 Tax=Oceanicoccus sagamiensis TaxID=716816 RepID=A0A1X9NJI9_9GAMM|nr:TonB-dependent receptor [Oceanicoccus sagamiensis]ARN75047.1 hypothetical protein BST96_13550 [Oceanicoccus sagamiensis]